MGDIDNAYKQIFSHPEMVRDLLRGFVREDWVAQLDFSTLEKISGSYVTDDVRDREDDMIWRIRWGAEWLYLYILLEFQATIDHFMAVRIGGYVYLLYQDLIKSGAVKNGEKLPPIFPLVLYNGRTPWTAATEVGDLIAPVPFGFDRFRPQMQYLLIEEVRYADAELAPLQNLAAALFRLEKSRKKVDIRRVLRELTEWLKSPEQISLRRAFATWLSRVLLPRKFPGARLPEMSDLHEVDSMLAENVQEWREEGRQEGLQEGLANILLLMLEGKYGGVSESDRNRVLTSGRATLEKWNLRILTCDTLDCVFKA